MWTQEVENLMICVTLDQNPKVDTYVFPGIFKYNCIFMFNAFIVIIL